VKIFEVPNWGGRLPGVIVCQGSLLRPARLRLSRGLFVGPKVPEGIVGLVARLAAGAKLVPALTARGPTLGHRVRYSSAEALCWNYKFAGLFSLLFSRKASYCP
jgi:hypothetical protein